LHQLARIAEGLVMPRVGDGSFRAWAANGASSAVASNAMRQ
jgi:hypothetical protein